MERKGIRLRRIQWTKYMKMSLRVLLRRVKALKDIVSGRINENRGKEVELSSGDLLIENFIDVYREIIEETGKKFRLSHELYDYVNKHIELQKNTENASSEIDKTCNLILLSCSRGGFSHCSLIELYEVLCLMESHLDVLDEQQSIEKIKTENESLKTQVKDLKRGLGFYCAWIGRNCDLYIEKQSGCFVMYDYELKDFEGIVTGVLKKGDINLEFKTGKTIETIGSGGTHCTKICTPIRSSKICIADVSEENTNVGLEIGIAKRFNIPVIFTVNTSKIKNIEDLSFDVQGFDCVLYENTIELDKKLTNKIKETLKNV